MKTLYCINSSLEYGEFEAHSEQEEQLIRAFASLTGGDVYDTKVEALSAIDRCQDQHRKNRSKEAV